MQSRHVRLQAQWLSYGWISDLTMIRLKSILVAVLGLSCASSVWAQNASVQLGFLLNFARYVEWPEARLKPGTAMRFCLAAGDAEMTSKFADLTKQMVGGQSIQVRLLARPSEVADCHVLFIPVEVVGSFAAWVSAAQDAEALTVSEYPDFVEAGGVIGLVQVGRSYRFDIDLRVAKKADLRIGSQLLKLARTVK